MSRTGCPSARTEPDASAPLDRAAGLAFCMGNAALYRRLLDGFRHSESTLVHDVAAALAEQRWGDALRRAHDMKGLAGTIGAHRLFATTQALHAAIAARSAAPAGAELERVRVELDAVLAEIDRGAPRA